MMAARFQDDGGEGAQLEIPSEGFTLMDPPFLLLGVLAGLFWLWSLRAVRPALPVASTALFHGLPRTLRARLWWLPGALQALAALCLAIALARPVDRELLPQSRPGLDILLVMDVSGSMNYPIDATPFRRGTGARRVELAKEQALEFIAGRPADRIGLVTFAGFPEIRCPLTRDHGALRGVIESLDAVQVQAEDGTELGAGLAMSASMLDVSMDGPRPDRVLVVLSDGESYDRTIPLEAGLAAVSDQEARVHSISLGREILPNLVKIARETGGEPFVAGTAEALQEVYRRIDALETVPLEDPRFRIRELFRTPLWGGAVLLAAAWLLAAGWIREAP